ncbi:hypothetical protein DL89DRAFT_132405 [Linderina pennispora]|uniref:Uncharacterized protein n=1 Tax=Linderina pennispora TaxID=61395 RepID=A0A1Y1VUZ6_9FUNG|nr:uncharacterized protein DL89DRAFT_132405 [Linderina pennispora]ORX65121.1 hypothetical protein DL89DRAFT_132405 [Linderina pennispora]
MPMPSLYISEQLANSATASASTDAAGAATPDVFVSFVCVECERDSVSDLLVVVSCVALRVLESTVASGLDTVVCGADTSLLKRIGVRDPAVGACAWLVARSASRGMYLNECMIFRCKSKVPNG